MLVTSVLLRPVVGQRSVEPATLTEPMDYFSYIRGGSRNLERGGGGAQYSWVPNYQRIMFSVCPPV